MVTTYRAVVERGTLRAMVPFTMAYPCAACGGTDRAEALGVLDTGCPWTTIPARALPGGHVGWDDLAGESRQMRSMFGASEYRWWDNEVSILGTRIAGRIRVHEGDLPDLPILGLEDFARHFRIAIDWGGPLGPLLHVERYPDAPVGSLQTVGPPDLRPLALQDLRVISYSDRSYVLSQDLTRYGMIGTLQLPRESRQARRARERASG
jgi:hypothetical protein